MSPESATALPIAQVAVSNLHMCLCSIQADLAGSPLDSLFAKAAKEVGYEIRAILDEMGHRYAALQSFARDGHNPDAEWLAAFRAAIDRVERLVAEVSDMAKKRPPSPPVAPVPPREGSLPGEWVLWRFGTEILATRVFRRLSAGTLEPVGDGPLRGVLDRCVLFAERVGDANRRLEISATLEAARTTIVPIAQQLVERGCTREECGDLIRLAEQQRERIRGPVVDAELEFATVEPIIVQD